jgi:hypothetical protein
VAEPLAITLFPGTPRYRERVVLDGREYVLVFRWSQREERFYLDLLDTNDALLVGSIKVVANWPLLRDSRGSGIALPAGELVALDTRSAPEDPRLDELGGTIQLTYVSAELAAELDAEAAA